MNADVVHTFILAGCFLMLFAVAELLHYAMNIKAEYTRKLVHVGTGLLTLLFPVLLHNHWLVLLLCASFAGILLVSLRFGLLRSINGIDRKSHGSISYPVAVYGCYLVYDHYSKIQGVAPYQYFYLPILTLAICDPVAALAGKRFPYGRYSIGRDTKTLAGSSAFFISSVAVVLVVGRLLVPAAAVQTGALHALLIGAAATVAEALSGKGLDNITIPATVAALLVLLNG